MLLEWSPELTFGGYRFLVIGSGPAGYFAAKTLSARGKVLVIEVGSISDPTGLGGDYYTLVSTGRPYPPLGSRLSAFGGTSNHWGGHSHPLSPEIFENRTRIAGWPIAYEDYAAHLSPAARFLNLLPFTQMTAPTGMESGVLEAYDDLLVTRFHYADPAVRLGDEAWLAQFRTATSIDVLPETRLFDITLEATGDRVHSIDILHRPSREKRTIPVETLILATGGIENARNLLWAGRKYGEGNPLLGGPNRLTGTHYSEHLNFNPIDVFIDSRADLSQASAAPGRPIHLAWELSGSFRRTHGLPRFGVFPESGELVVRADNDFLRHAPAFVGQSSTYRQLDPQFQFEQTPTPTSYIKLLPETDVDGVARAEVHWDIIPDDLTAMRRAIILFCGVLNQKGFAKSRLRKSFASPDWSEVELSGSSHHMGTTRIGDSRLTGVVDRNCQVFGLSNLFVAGSSVFPSGDYVNPTLNLVALTDRLASFIKAQTWDLYSFGIAGNGNSALLSGWSHLEAEGVWSEGPTAIVRILQPVGSEIVLGGHAYRDVGGRVLINGTVVYLGLLKHAFGAAIQVAPSAQLEIAFEIDDPQAPKDNGENEDTRKLGVFLTGVEYR